MDKGEKVLLDLLNRVENMTVEEYCEFHKKAMADYFNAGLQKITKEDIEWAKEEICH